MIKAIQTLGDGRPLLLLGLTKKNCKLLLEGKPIKFDMAELGRPDMGEVVIVGGKNEGAIMRALGPIEAEETIGSICPRCNAGRRGDGSCDCLQHRL